MPNDDRSEAGGAPLLEELLQTVPRFVDRTRSQAEFARSVAALLPCVGGWIGRRPQDDEAIAPGVPEHERVDVLGVLAADDDASPIPEPVLQADAAAEAAEVAEPDTAEGSAQRVDPVPTEAELPIQDYDSLAASQVVPRLATLTPDELRVVRAYEVATRGRQTILHRVAQLLAG